MDQERDELLETWLREYGTSILRTCFVCLSDMRDAEDALQETFLKAWRAMDRYERRNGASEKTWLTHIAINVCRDMRRSKWLRIFDRSVDIDSLQIPVEGAPEVSIALMEEIMRLPVRLREVIFLFYYQDMTLAEIGALLGAPVSTIGDRLHRARTMLRKALKGG